jgi:predicted nucleotidyltransferase
MLKSKYSQKIKKWIKANKVLDVIQFGSSVRGSLRPNDIDICIFLPVSREKESIDLVDSLGKILDDSFQINTLSDTAFAQGKGLSKTLLSEGVSLLSGKPFSSVFGFYSKTLFTYSLQGLTSSERVRFHYVMRGRRDSEGMLTKLKAELLGDGVILVPTSSEDELSEIFKKWKCQYKARRVLYG